MTTLEQKILTLLATAKAKANCNENFSHELSFAEIVTSLGGDWGEIQRALLNLEMHDHVSSRLSIARMYYAITTKSRNQVTIQED